MLLYLCVVVIGVVLGFVVGISEDKRIDVAAAIVSGVLLGILGCILGPEGASRWNSLLLFILTYLIVVITTFSVKRKREQREE